MRILVYNPAALHGGSMRILNNFLNDITKDLENRYFIVISKQALKKLEVQNSSNVKFIPINRSYYSRYKWLYFDIFKFITLYKIDVIISLENVCNIFLNRIPQFVYLHQSLQFASPKVLGIKLFIKAKMLNGFIIKQSCKHAKAVFVQTDWVKQALINNYRIKSNNIFVVPPKVPKFIEGDIKFEIIQLIRILKREKRYIGLCVTNASSYKKLDTLLRFVANNNKRNSLKVSMIFTISENQSSYASKMKELANNLEISNDVFFVGELNMSTINYLYEESDALFYASAIETLGLPLIEAMSKDLRIFAPDLPYVKDVCRNYAFTYDFDNFESLLETFSKHCFNKPKRHLNYVGLSFKKIIDKISILLK